MKILWIASWFPTSYSPFNGDFIERMGKAVAPFCEVHLLHVGEGPVKKIVVSIEHDVYDRVIVTVPLTVNWNYFLRFFRLWRGFRIGIKIVKARFGSFQIIHLHVIYTLGIFYMMSKFLRKIPLVITEHWAGFSKHFRKDLKFYHKIIAWLCIKRAKIVLPVSTSLLNDMVGLGFKGHYKVVPNVVDLQLFSPSISKKSSKFPFFFLVVSSLFDEIKNISGVIRAFKKISQKYPECCLKIIGSGQDEEKLKSLTFLLGISEIVVFLGELPHSSVAEMMQHSDALVVFSRVETFSCVISEALSVGLPVITSNCGGITSSILSNQGIIVDSEDENALFDAMKRMIEEYSSFEPCVRRNEVDKFNSETIGTKLFEIYKNYANSSF